MFNNSFFDNIGKKTGVDMNDVFQLANSLQYANFQDEETVRQVIQQVSQLAGHPVTEDKEEQIVEALLKNNMPIDFSTISDMVNGK
ncbi:stage VI sporulation protein F [Bacillus solimangrovi]|uniref:Sporulation protein n=1 Tax=Bacillus solimangrovi TaxID=1305675 RepID=A0A1E5LFA6_9BACI|nr:stage VI sporulation protein F [Bacillus solimangrovi]OEH92752.1 sporulation protein [Bacillus solimangrovi]